MKPIFKLLPDGGFVAGDTDSRLTSYAYPSSPHAIVAEKHARLIAEDMLGSERIEYRRIPAIAEYDARNWKLLEEKEANRAKQ